MFIILICSITGCIGSIIGYYLIKKIKNKKTPK